MDLWPVTCCSPDSVLTAGVQRPGAAWVLKLQSAEWLPDAGFAGIVVVFSGLGRVGLAVLSRPGSLSLRGLSKDLLRAGQSIGLRGGEQTASRPPGLQAACTSVLLFAQL